MKIGSWCVVGALFGGAVSLAGCSSSKGPGATEPDASSGGAVGSGGTTGSGGKTTGSGGKTAGTGGIDSGAGGATGGTSTGGTGGVADAGPDGATGSGGTTGTGGTGADAGSNPLQHGNAYPAVAYTVENPRDANKETLGKILFWEEQIGQLDTMACGTCHRAEAGGSDPRAATAAAHIGGFDGIVDPPPVPSNSDDLRVALGMPTCDSTGKITNATLQTTTRKPPTYLDAMFATQVFWDGRAGYCKNGEPAGSGCFYDPDLPSNAPALIVGQIDPTTNRLAGGALEAQAIGPPANSHEMACAGRTWGAIATKLKTAVPLAKARAVPNDMSAFIANNGNNYPQMFAAVYGTTAKVNPSTDPDNVINTRRIVFAITTHERRLTSDQTPWDRWNAGDNSALTPAQVAGFEAFMGKARCGQCHAPPLFTDTTFHFLGFHKPQWDIGRQATTGNANDEGLMKTPTLRNVGLREAGGLLHSGEGPGHDLPTVMSLYKSGGFRNDPDIQTHIDPNLQALPTLTQGDIDNIIDFLRHGLTDPRVQGSGNGPLPPFDHPKLGSEP